MIVTLNGRNKRKHRMKEVVIVMKGNSGGLMGVRE